MTTTSFVATESSGSDAEVESWVLNTTQGYQIAVPPRLASITTWSILEQEGWFEHELGFVGRVLAGALAGGRHMLDIGANHGVYALLGARLLSQQQPPGRVWAFEPTTEPRLRLHRSVAVNGYSDCLAIEPIGLSDTPGPIEFTISHESELSGREGVSGALARETVMLMRLDDWMQQSGLSAADVGFVKLDAEGEESAILRGGRHFFRDHEGVVMFELRHGQALNLSLVAEFEASGYQVYRLLDALSVLVPFGAEQASTCPDQDAPLNCLAVKPTACAQLFRAGLLTDEVQLPVAMLVQQPPAVPTEAVGDDIRLARACDQLWLWCGRQDSEVIASWPPALARAFGFLACSHFDEQLSRVDAWRLAGHAVALVQQHLQDDTGKHKTSACLLLIHALHLYGHTRMSISVMQSLYSHWPGENDLADQPWLPPTLAGLAPTPGIVRDQDSLQGWLQLQLFEFYERRRAFSSYFAPAHLGNLQHAVSQAVHDAEMVRRYALGLMRRGGRPPSPQHKELVRSGINCRVWEQLLAS